jgi:hypothetical protein
MENYQVAIINDVSVAQPVKNHSKPQVSTYSRIDHIVNNITTNSITRHVRNVVKVLKDNVYNSKILQFDILHVLLALYSPFWSLTDYRRVMYSLMKSTSRQRGSHIVIDTRDFWGKIGWKRERREYSSCEFSTICTYFWDVAILGWRKLIFIPVGRILIV